MNGPKWKISCNIWKGQTIKILAIETSQFALSLGVWAQGQIAFVHLPDVVQQSRLILAHIDALLAAAKLALKDLDAIAVSVGPGRFTGLRLGIAVAQGLALPFDLPVIPVSSLQILAQGFYRCQALDRVFVDIDAMMGERFVGSYRQEAGLMMPSSPDRLVKVVSPEPGVTYLRLDHPEPHAQDLLSLAMQRYSLGEMISVGDLEPVYLRDETAWVKGYAQPR